MLHYYSRHHRLRQSEDYFDMFDMEDPLGHAPVLERNSCGRGSAGEGRERMSRPRNTEPQANGALARALRRRNPDAKRGNRLVGVFYVIA